LNQCTIS